MERPRLIEVINVLMLLRLFFGLALIGASHAALQRDPPYAPCVVCHQLSAWGSQDGNIPNLAGQQRRYLQTQLAQFASGARAETAMQIVAAHPKPAEHSDFAAVATYLSALRWNPTPVTGPGEHLQVGQEIYMHICAACHGADGRGQPGNRAPRIAGQHYPYLRRQIEEAARWHRDLAPPEMTRALRGMLESEKDALADYVSRLALSRIPVITQR